MKDKSREDHFWTLISLKEQIDEIMVVLKYIIETDICELNIKIWSLNGLAMILTPYISKAEWNFQGLLDDRTLLNRIRQTAKGNDVQPCIQMIAELHPYIQNTMKRLGVNDFVHRK